MSFGRRGLSEALILQGMVRYSNLKAGSMESNWFSRLPQRVQAALLMLLTAAVTVVLLVLGVHTWHSGHPIVLSNHATDAGEWFLMAGGFGLISAGLLTVAMGWVNPRVRSVSETHWTRQELNRMEDEGRK